jgi:hypothetical protein
MKVLTRLLIAASLCSVVGCGTSLDRRSTRTVGSAVELTVIDGSGSYRRGYDSVEQCDEARQAVLLGNDQREAIARLPAKGDEQGAQDRTRKGYAAVTGAGISDNRMSASAVCGPTR